MVSAETIKINLKNTVNETDFPGLGEKYRGKVRDNYTNEAKKERIIVVTDRISAFDVVLGTIPFKGQVLNQLAEFWFEETKDVAKSHFISCPDPNIMVVRLCETFPVEVIVRNYITGSLWREYDKGEDNYGLGLPAGLTKDQKLDKPILTPSSKADTGHDMPMKREDVVKLVPEEKYARMEETALKLFERGSQLAADRGLILVDTKYEFGENDGEILVIDEIHTPDSSRFWVSESYDELYAAGKDQQMLDKEFIRQWLIKEKNYMGDGEAPQIDDEIIVSAAQKYMDLFKRITGKEIEIVEGDVNARMKENLTKAGYKV